MKDRRIAILVSMGWGVRNVLMSKAMDVLHQHAEIHVFSTFNHVPAFRQRFRDMDGLQDIIECELQRPSKMLYLWNTYTFYKISPSATHQHKLRKKTSRRKKTRTALDTPITFFGRIRRSGRHLLSSSIEAFSRQFGNRLFYRVSRRMLCESFRLGNRYKTYKQYLRRHRIDTVVSSNPLNITEYPALIAARDLRLKTIAIITSWDNLSSKRPLIIDFDEYLVWNQIMAGEVAHYYQPEADQIHEVGPSQFDFYFNDKLFQTRQEFCRQLGFDPDRKIIVHSTVTQQLMPDEPKILEKLLLALKEGRVVGAPNLLVRLHPKRTFQEFRALAEDPRWKGLPVAWTLAGTPVRSKNDMWCPLDEEMRLLTNTVRHGDVNLNVFSTMLLDFAILDKPAIIISHDSNDRPLWHYEKYEHLQPVHQCGGNPFCHSFAETLTQLNAYLTDPTQHSEGRRKLAQLQCGPLLGQSWKHMADAILNGRRRTGKR